MRTVLKHEVIVIGADHHNTLASIRCLGRNGCRQTALIHTKQLDSTAPRLSASKYIKHSCYTVEENENAMVQWLLAHAKEEKQILFPCSDFAAYTIDAFYDALCDHYIIPGFLEEPGKVVQLMDKYRQSEFARSYDLPMARTWQISDFSIPADMVYPCIVKPELSAFGSKSDIVICEKNEDLQAALERLKNAGYEQLVVQQFLQKQYEVCAYGCLINDAQKQVGGMIRKVREFPPKGGGSLTFAQFIEEEQVCALRDRVLQILHDCGYRGQYDIEFLVCKDGVYLNEINFRHSGNGYALVQNGVHAPYIGCLDAAGISVSNRLKTKVKTGKYHMDEISDLMHLSDNHTTIVKWFLDCLRTSAFAKWDISDLGGTFAYYKPIFAAVKKKFFRRR